MAIKTFDVDSDTLVEIIPLFATKSYLIKLKVIDNYI